MLIDVKRAILLAIDFQPKLLSVMPDRENTVAAAERALRLASRINLPVMFTEQYREGLGETIEALSAICPDAPHVNKKTFSCYANPTVEQHLRPFSQVILMGVETHICVLQTALELLQTETRQVYVLESAVSSRCEKDHTLGLERMKALGAQIITFDMLAYECLRTADYPEFKDISKTLLR